MRQGILLTVDYHDQNCVIRRFDRDRRTEETMTIPTTEGDVTRVLTESKRQAGRGKVVWLQESTTGWARVKALVEPTAEFVLANVLQMPLPPKGRRRKTDAIDTARLQREYLTGDLPRAYQPPAEWRQRRRVVALRENLVSRRTSLRNRINRYFAHETWQDRSNLWSRKGQKRLRTLVASRPARDQLFLNCQLDELDDLDNRLKAIEADLLAIYRESEEARRVDAIRGIGVIAAVSIVTRIGPVERFPTAEHLIGYAGLAPGVHQSDETRRCGRIGGGGTDKHLRCYLMEASIWARNLARFKPAYEKVERRRGRKVGRIVVARMLLRSLYKVLRDGVAFDPTAPPARR